MLANKHLITNQIPMIKDQIDKMRLNRCNLHAAIQNLNFVSVDQAHIPLGGRLEFFIKNWEKVSSDQKILNQVKGFKIDFVQEQFQNNQIISKGNRYFGCRNQSDDRAKSS